MCGFTFLFCLLFKLYWTKPVTFTDIYWSQRRQEAHCQTPVVTRVKDSSRTHISVTPVTPRDHVYNTHLFVWWTSGPSLTNEDSSSFVCARRTFTARGKRQDTSITSLLAMTPLSSVLRSSSWNQSGSASRKRTEEQYLSRKQTLDLKHSERIEGINVDGKEEWKKSTRTSSTVSPSFSLG